MRKSRSVEKWSCVDDSLLQKTRVFDLRVQRMRAPHKEYEDDFYYLRAPDWVNIVPITQDKEVVLVEQFRHGIRDLSLEIPGGIVDESENDPASTGVRELEEETGYIAGQVEALGTVHPNPAIQINRCHFFLATDVRLASEQNLDPAEDIAVVTVPLNDIPQLLAEERITHSLSVCAFMKFFQKCRGEFRGIRLF